MYVLLSQLFPLNPIYGIQWQLSAEVEAEDVIVHVKTIVARYQVEHLAEWNRIVFVDLEESGHADDQVGVGPRRLCVHCDDLMLDLRKG